VIAKSTLVTARCVATRYHPFRRLLKVAGEEETVLGYRSRVLEQDALCDCP
jgi:hypothetical protein